jgi:hypothetical protein
MVSSGSESGSVLAFGVAFSIELECGLQPGVVVDFWFSGSATA